MNTTGGPPASAHLHRQDGLAAVVSGGPSDALPGGGPGGRQGELPDDVGAMSDAGDPAPAAYEDTQNTVSRHPAERLSLL